MADTKTSTDKLKNATKTIIKTKTVEKVAPVKETKVVVKNESKKEEKSYGFDTMMISKNEQKIFNKLLGMHMYCIQYYTAMSVCCDLAEIEGGKEFFKDCCMEEKRFMYKTQEYLKKNKAVVKPEVMQYESKMYEDVDEIVEYTFKHSVDVMKKYGDICNALKNEANPYSIRFFDCYLDKASETVDKIREVYHKQAFPTVLTCGCKLSGPYAGDNSLEN